jgi:hypothetical protein
LSWPDARATIPESSPRCRVGASPEMMDWRLKEPMANHNNWMRRDVLKAGLSTLLAAPVASAAGGEAVAVGLVLRETAGLRRFNFPVHALLSGRPPGAGPRLRLRRRPAGDGTLRRRGRRRRPSDIAKALKIGRASVYRVLAQPLA